MVYKCVPHIYNSFPAEEDAYALFVHDARLVRRDVSSAIDTRMPLSLRKGRQGLLKRARGTGLCVEQVDQFDCFWAVLEQNLVEATGRNRFTRWARSQRAARVSAGGRRGGSPRVRPAAVCQPSRETGIS